MLLTLPASPGCASRVFFRCEPHCCRGRWPLGSPSLWGLNSLPSFLQFNPCSFPQYTAKFHFVRRKSLSRGSVFTSPQSSVCARKPFCPIPALGRQGSHPKNTLCVLVLSATERQSSRAVALPTLLAGPLHALSLPAEVYAEALFIHS